jgi:hypothetical protein
MAQITAKAARRGLYDEFARFLTNPTMETLRAWLSRNGGEHAHADFKEGWPPGPKLARHLLGLANMGDGCLVVGVAEKEDKTFEVTGLAALTDKTDIYKSIRKYVPGALLDNVEVVDFPYESAEYQPIAGKKFQVAFVTSDPAHLPYVSMAQGEGIQTATVYVRRGASTEQASYDELQRIINRRLETGHSSQRELDLREHVEQLKVLYAQIERTHYFGEPRGTAAYARMTMEALNLAVAGYREKRPNPHYPQEDFDPFIARMIAGKKKRIAIELDVVGLIEEPS